MSLHVVGHDGSERGDDAVALASRLAVLYDARLLAVHVIAMPPVRDRFAGPVIERLERHAGEVLARAAGRIDPDIATPPRSVFASSAAAGLQEVCAAEGAALVTVGSSHRGPLGRVLAGTSAERLLTGSQCPVALAPRGYAAEAAAIGSVIAGYDGGDEARAALDVAIDLARRAKVELRIVVVAEQPAVYLADAAADLTELVARSNREQAEHMAAEGVARVPHDVIARPEIVTGEPGRALASVARAPTDVLVVGSRRYGPPRSVLVGTVGHHLARAAPAPVLVVPRGVEVDRAGELLSAPAAAG